MTSIYPIGKQGSRTKQHVGRRNEIQDFKRKDIKNQEKMMIINPWKTGFFDQLKKVLLSKHCL